MLRRRFDREDAFLGSLAGSDVFLRFVDAFDWTILVNSLDFLAHNVVTALLLTGLAKSGGPLGAVATIARLTLFGYIAYRITPSIFPSGFGPLIREHKFRLIVAGAVSVGAASLKINTQVVNLMAYFLAFTVFTVYLSLSQHDPFDSEDGHVFRVMTHITPEKLDDSSIKQQLRGDDPEEMVTRVLSIAVVATVFALASILLAILSWGVGLFFPLPQLIIIGWVLFGTDWIPHINDQSRIDLEETLITTIPTAVNRAPMKGLVTLPFIGTGIAISGIWFLAAITLNLVLSLNDVLAISTLGLRGLVFFVILMSLATYGLYGLWYWIRVAHRLPSFLATFQRRYTQKEASNEGKSQLEASLVVRPPGYLIPQFLLVVFPIGFLLMVERVGYSVPLAVGFLTIWVVAFLGTVQSVLWTLEATPQPPMTERRAIPTAWFSGWIGLTGLTVIGNHPSVMTGGTVGEAISSAFSLLAGGFAVVLVFFFADVNSYFSRYEDPRQYGIFVYAGVIAAVSVMTGRLSTLSTTTLFMGIGILLVLYISLDYFA